VRELVLDQRVVEDEKIRKAGILLHGGLSIVGVSGGGRAPALTKV
jgi:hypothetical protein